MNEHTQFVAYIRENPVRRGLVENARDYVYSSAADRTPPFPELPRAKAPIS